MTIDFGFISDPNNPQTNLELQTTVAPHRVYVSDRLDAGLDPPFTAPTWTLLPHVYCNSIKNSLTHSGLDTASIEYFYGRQMMQIGDTTRSDYPPLDLVGKFIRIEIDQPAGYNMIMATRYVLEENNEQGGAEVVDNSQPPDPPNPERFLYAGRQRWTLVGLEYFLDREQVDESVHYPGNRIKRSLAFNAGTSGQAEINYAERGNKDPQLANNLPVFLEETLMGAAELGLQWSALDMIQYLFGWLNPKDYRGEAKPCKFGIATAAIPYLANYYPGIQPYASTVLATIKNILSPQRGLCGWWTYDDNWQGATPNTLYLNVNSFATSDIPLPSGRNQNPASYIPANNQQHDWPINTGNPYNDNRFQTPLIRKSRARKYTSVIARGARRRAVFTASYAAGNLAIDWSAAEETKYKEGAKNGSGDPPYAGLTPDKKQKRNDATRRSDEFENVYQAHKIVDGWDGKSNNGDTPGGEAGDPQYKNYACPTFDPTDPIVIIGGDTFRLSGLRLMNRMPLKYGYDYSESYPEADPQEGYVKIQRKTTSKRPDWLPPFAFMPVDTAKTKYQYVEKLGSANFLEGDDANNQDSFTSYRLSMNGQSPGFKVIPTNKVNHTMALNHFDETDTDTETSSFNPELDYTDLRITCCGEWDAFVEYQVPEVLVGVKNVPLEPLVLDLGDMFRLDYLAANTIVSLDNGTPVVATGGFLRDDRAVLGDIATIAWQWYQRDRAAVTVAVTDIRNALDIGWMITEIDQGESYGVPVYSVISSVDYDVRTGTMTVKTEMMEMSARTAKAMLT